MWWTFETTVFCFRKNEYSGGSNTKHIQILDGCMWSVNGPDHSETLLLASLVNKFKFTWRRAFQWLKYIVKINTFFNKSLQFFPSKWSNWLLLRKLIHQTILFCIWTMYCLYIKQSLKCPDFGLLGLRCSLYYYLV